ncbi:MAG: exo-alpha-sialidase [Pseudomonadales bacterium]|nr:exo-alpha-sialidase [Pseudomonadales bacterium]
MRKRAFHLLVGAALVAGYFAASPAHIWQPAPSMQVEPAEDIPEQSRWQSRFASDADTRLVHAASMVELPDGSLRAFWFAGSREGAADVAIHSAVFDPASGRWSDETPVVTRKQISDAWGRHIRKLGNAVPVLDSDGRMRLFVVAVSFGGWAASRLVVLESFDQGASWSFDKALASTPFLNISTLVKTPPIRYSDGSIGLPVYHEMIGKFGEILRLDEDNRVLGKARIGHGRKAIQPLVLVDSPTEAVAFLRNENEPNNGYLYQSHSHDGGWHWESLSYSPLENPSAALGGVALGRGHWLIAANCNRYERDDLCIRETRDGGKHWQERWELHDREAWRGKHLEYPQFEDLVDDELVGAAKPENLKVLLERVRDNKCHAEKGCEFQYDYPYMLQTRNGDLHMLYTWNKSAIRHAWLKADSKKNKERADDA